jgi:alkylation response protein AidB-like acyl-CoA dehydrogenase
MTEPGTGSDLQGIKTRAVKEGDHYILNGSKTFITNGINADLVIVVAQTNPEKGAQGFSLLGVERGMPGFERGRHLDKIGLDAQDTAELYFTDVKVPVENLIGEEGMGFMYLMQNLPQERLSIAIMAAAAMEAVLDETIEYVTQRKAFGKPIGSFQNSRFLLAELATETTAVRLVFGRSPFDYLGSGIPITGYQVYRRAIIAAPARARLRRPPDLGRHSSAQLVESCSFYSSPLDGYTSYTRAVRMGCGSHPDESQKSCLQPRACELELLGMAP